MKPSKSAYDFSYNRAADAIKTRIVLDIRSRRNLILSELQALRSEMLRLPRTKRGEVYKRALSEFNALIERRDVLRRELDKQFRRYWLLRRIERGIGPNKTGAALFGVFNSYQELPGVRSRQLEKLFWNVNDKTD